MFSILLFFLTGLTACSSSDSSTNGPSKQSSSSGSVSISKGGLEAVVAPVSGRTLSGSVVVSINSVPENARQILFIFKPKNLPPTDNPFIAPNVVAKFLDPSPQKVDLETLSVENGDYELYVGVSAKDSSGWLVESRTEFSVKN
jgi:hypothetical protein